MSNLDSAIAYLESGLSVLPADVKTKKIVLPEWKPYQSMRLTVTEAPRHWNNGQAVACVGGPVSGNLEFIDFDEPGIFVEYCKLLDSWNLLELRKRLVVETTQTPGRFHVAYRHEGKPQGNQRLASRPATEEELEAKPLQKSYGRIETRGDGGYCLISPTPGYDLKQLDYLKLPTISADEREALLAAARTFDRCPQVYASKGQGRVGDDYNARASIHEVLEPLGWQQSKGDKWTRPGKSLREGYSATWNHNGNRHFCLFSSSAGLDPGNYDLFGLYARLWHGGDFKEAAKAAAESGYGETPQQTGKRKTRDDKPERTEPRKWITLDQIQAKEIPWLLEPYLPMGIGYVLVWGDSGWGKTTSILSFLSSFSNGINPVTGDQCEPLRSILLSAEDSAEHVIVPRLLKMGADMSKIMVPELFNAKGEPDPLTLDLDGVAELRKQVRDFKARIVVIDPLSAFFDGDSMDDRLQARAFTARLHDLSVSEVCCPIVIHHVNKAVGRQGRYRAAGSQDFVDACRSGLMVVRAGPDSDEYALTHEKHNLTFKGDALGYTFSREKGFEWTGISDLTSSAMTAALVEEHVSHKDKRACQVWIEEQLEGGPLLSDSLKRGAIKEGYSEVTYNRARAEMRDRLKSYQVDKGVRGAPWWTKLRFATEQEAPYELP